mgnify:CR=1 FL=1|jgi:hypothetical protein
MKHHPVTGERSLLKFFYELTLLQRGVSHDDQASNAALFRLIHNLSSMGLDGVPINKIRDRFLLMCETDFGSLPIYNELIKCGDKLSPK